MSKLVSCRYNPSHQVKPTRLMFHEEKCPNKNTNKIKVCPYNPNHKIPIENYDEHLNSCQNKIEDYFEILNELKKNSDNNLAMKKSELKESSQKKMNNEEVIIEEKFPKVCNIKLKIREEEKIMKNVLEQEDISSHDVFEESKVNKNIIDDQFTEKFLCKKIRLDESYKNKESPIYDKRQFNNNPHNDKEIIRNDRKNSPENKKTDKVLIYEGEEFNNFF